MKKVLQRLEIWSETHVMPRNQQLTAFRALLIFLTRFPDAGSCQLEERASTVFHFVHRITLININAEQFNLTKITETENKIRGAIQKFVDKLNIFLI